MKIYTEEDFINESIKVKKEMGIITTKKISDTHHTFGELYHHRTLLFSIICNQNKDYSWKSWLHHDNTMFDDSFIVGINTPKGQYSYHCKPKYWDLFQVKELSNAPEYDGHMPDDIERLLSLL